MVFSVIIMVIVLFFSKGIMGDRELSWKRIKHPSEVVKVGDVVKVVVLNVDEKRHRIGLSMKQAK